MKDIYNKLGIGSTSKANPDVVASSSGNVSGDFTSERKRSISLGLKRDEEVSNECDDKKRRASISDTSFEVSERTHSQSPATKRAKLESSPSSATRLDSSPENSPLSSKGLDYLF